MSVYITNINSEDVQLLDWGRITSTSIEVPGPYKYDPLYINDNTIMYWCDQHGYMFQNRMLPIIVAQIIPNENGFSIQLKGRLSGFQKTIGALITMFVIWLGLKDIVITGMQTNTINLDMFIPTMIFILVLLVISGIYHGTKNNILHEFKVELERVIKDYIEEETRQRH